MENIKKLKQNRKNDFFERRLHNMVLAPHMTLAPAAYRVEVFLFMRIPRFTVGVQPGFSAMFDEARNFWSTPVHGGACAQ